MWRGLCCNWLWHNMKLYAAGEMKEEMAEKFR